MAQLYNIEAVRKWARECSNWGRFGPDDELGTLNYITPDKIREAAQTVRHGKTISLASPLT
jgi:hypothetical protein